MDFSDALRQVKRGRRLYRAGWNGRDQWIFLVGAEDKTAPEPMVGSVPAGSMVGFNNYIGIRTRDNTVTPWLASQADLLAEDWVLHDNGAEASYGR